MAGARHYPHRHGRRGLARALPLRRPGDHGGAPPLDADRRQGPPRARAHGQPLVAGAAIRVGAGADHVAHARRRPRSRDGVRLHRPPARDPHRRRRDQERAARTRIGRRLLRRDHGGSRRPWRPGRDPALPERAAIHRRLPRGHRFSSLRRGRGAPLLVGARADRPGHVRLTGALPGQGQPRPLLLGRRRPRGDPLLGTHRAPTRRRRPELSGLGAADGLQPRGEQLRLLARRVRRGDVLFLRLPRAAGLRRPHRRAGGRRLRQEPRRVRPPLHGSPRGGGPRLGVACLLSVDLRSRR